MQSVQKGLLKNLTIEVIMHLSFPNFHFILLWSATEYVYIFCFDCVRLLKNLTMYIFKILIIIAIVFPIGVFIICLLWLFHGSKCSLLWLVFYERAMFQFFASDAFLVVHSDSEGWKRRIL